MIKVDRCLFVNRAPFKENLEIIFKDGVNVLCGINGRGKTTILSYIVDAFYEMARPNYSGSFEGKENKYYRVSSSSHAIDPNSFSFVYIRFKTEEKTIDYIDARGQLSKADYESLVKFVGKIEYERINYGLASNNNVKLFSCDESDKAIKDAFQKNVLTYFPSYRYELPGYLNVPYKDEAGISNSVRFNEQLLNPIEVPTGLKDLSGWLLDVVLDWEISKDTQKNKEKKGTLSISPESIILENISQLLGGILSSKNYSGKIILGIGRRNQGGNRVSIVHKLADGQSERLCPSLSLLSSGEAALLCLFGEIIRQADRLNNNLSLSLINGVVLIDEVEKHLHIRLQKEILPKLLKLFPRVQFIVTSHSPFLNMGLASEPDMNSHIYDLDNGAIECDPTTNEMYQSTYELFSGERNTYAKALAEISPRIEALTKPLVISEGKTDWKHLKKALAVFKSNGEFEDLDFDLFEYEKDFGDSKLDSALKHFSQFPNRHKVIGVFDCDEANGKKIHNNGGIQEYGNGVYGMSIPVPEYRTYNQGGISIEFLYQDNDLKKTDENNRRIYTTSEFDANGRLMADPKIGVRNAKEVKEYTDITKEKIHDHDVIDITGNSLALTKENFAVNILNSVAPFDEIDFSGFRAVFERLRSIII